MEGMDASAVRDLLGMAVPGPDAISTQGGLLRTGGVMTGLLGFSTERVNVQSDATGAQLKTTAQLSFISVTQSTGYASCTVTLPPGSVDGQLKMVVATFIAAGVHVVIAAPVMLPGAAAVGSGFVLDNTGQSVSLVWDMVGGVWLNMNTGAMLL